jgi:predicted transcriptional regulator/ribosome-associated translation inhibitor RaiA
MSESVSSLVARDLVTSNFVQVDSSSPLSKAFAALKKGSAAEAVVMDGKKVAGLLSESGLLRNVDLTTTKVSSVSRSAPSVGPSDSFNTLVRLMRDSDVRTLPVLDKGKMVGVVTAQEVISRLQSHDGFSGMDAKSLATFNPLVISESSDLGKAVQQMRRGNVRKLPVVDTAQKPIGVIRIEDVATDVLLGLDRSSRESFKLGSGRQSVARKPGLALNVKSVMDVDVPVVSSSEKGKRIVQLMAKQVNPVVLVSGNGLSGIISVQSIFDAYLNRSSSVEFASITSPVQISHLPDLDEVDTVFVQKLLDRTYGKVERILKGEHSMHAVFKQSNKAGLRAQTEVRLTVEGAGRRFNASASEWKVRLAVKQACEALEHEIEKAYKSGKSSKRRA